MTGVVKHIDNRQHILSQASAWLAKIESNELTQQEQQELNAWVKQSKSHQEALVEMAQNIDRLKEAAAHSSTSAEVQSDSKILKNWSWITKIAAAAVFLILIPTAYYLQVMTNFTSTNGDYVTTKGSQQMIELADGSLVTLNTDSRLIVEYENGNRFLNLLKGEANFDVASDKHHPFVVRAGDGDVQAIGTSFAVRLEDETVNVLVSHGKVLVRADKTKKAPALSEVSSSTSQLAQSDHPQELRESVVVGAGKRVVIENNLVESVIDETTDDVDRHLYWRKGYLAFKDQSLNQVVAEVSRYATFNIVISEPSIGDMRVGGYYPIDNLETVFSSFEINLGLVVEKHNDNTYYIKSDKSENQEKS